MSISLLDREKSEWKAQACEIDSMTMSAPMPE